MSSTIEIQKKCEWCGAIFIAQKTTTAYCSPRCANLAYKARKRGEKVITYKTELAVRERNKPIEDLKSKEFLTPTQAAKLLGISRATLYRYLADEIIKAVQFSGKTLVRRNDIDRLFDNADTYQKRLPREQSPITEFYTTAEITSKFGVQQTWIYKVANKYSIPKTFYRGRTYWSKKHVDKYFTKQTPPPVIAEWYYVHEAMERYNMTRDQIYHYVKDYNIPKVREGKYTKISKPDLDKLFEAPKIE